jgi:hypothetical protein
MDCGVDERIEQSRQLPGDTPPHAWRSIIKWLFDTMRVDVEGAMHRALGVACMGPHGLDPARNVDFARFQLERGTKTFLLFRRRREPDDDIAVDCALINMAAQSGQDLALHKLLLRDYQEATYRAAALNTALSKCRRVSR